MSPDIALDIADVTKTFGATTALESVRLQVAAGELVTLLGPSGSGKTTLLRLIVGFEVPTSGTILLHGRDISRLSPADRSAGMVFQNYALFPHMTVAQNIAYGLRLRRWKREDQRARVAELLEMVQLSGYEERYPRQLSGGQQQRVALARALAYKPDIILMDEPLGALDRALRIEMEQVIRRIHREIRPTVIYVTHDQQEALALADRIAIMRNGSLMCVGTPEELYHAPANSFVAGFFANANLVPATPLGPLAGERARVGYPGGEAEVRVVGSPEGAVLLAIRPRTFRRDRPEDAIALQGAVVETLLFGDEREVVLDVAGVGRVVAVMGARESADLAPGEHTTFYVPAEDAVLVADVDAAGGETQRTPNPGVAHVT